MSLRVATVGHSPTHPGDHSLAKLSTHIPTDRGADLPTANRIDNPQPLVDS